jgi:hypothetical protein
MSAIETQESVKLDARINLAMLMNVDPTKDYFSYSYNGRSFIKINKAGENLTITASIYNYSDYTGSITVKNLPADAMIDVVCNSDVSLMIYSPTEQITILSEENVFSTDKYIKKLKTKGF